MHIPESQYCFAYGKNELRIRLRAAKNDLDSVTLIYAVKYDWLTNRKSVPMQKGYSDALYDYYTVALPVSDSRIGYVFYVTRGEEAYYYSEEGLTVDYDHEKSYYNFFQFPYINAADVHARVGLVRPCGVLSDLRRPLLPRDREKDTSYINKNGARSRPEELLRRRPEGHHRKAGLSGELGITALYLTPVFRSPSNHKYDTVDYDRVDEMFGSNDDLKELVQLAHRRA